MKRRIMAVMAAFIMSTVALTNTAFADYYTEYQTLRFGMQSSNVTDLQKDLKQLGYFGYSSTGYFGSLTRQSVINYQYANKLAPDGIVGHATAREIKVDQLLQMAKGYIGVPYVWGGTSPSGFDCSGFTHYVYLKNGITISRTTELQYNQGTWISKSALRPGDLVFFTTYKPGPSHVGIYLGNGQFIHASSGAGKVTISDINKAYYAERYIGAKRIIK